MAVLSPRRTPATAVRCGECGSHFELSLRNAQRARSEGREPRCQFCRRPAHPKPTKADYTFWTEKFSMEEIKQMAEALFA